MSECRSCKAKIIWCKTKNGKSIPVDYDEELRGDDGKFPEEFDDDRMTTHFETCPFADEHRKRKGGGDE